jgi:hypothetical protein
MHVSLFLKPDEDVLKVAVQDDDEDLLTDDEKGKDADGDRNMRDANPALNPQGGAKEPSSANPQSYASQSGNSHRQATMIQEALDMACEQLFDEISIKVMLEKDSVGWKSYIPLTDEEWRMYNAMVSPPVKPHPFFSDEFEQPGVTHLSLVGGTPIFYYPEPTHPAEGDDGVVPAPILLGVAGSPVGVATLHPPIIAEDTIVPLLADEGGPMTRRTRPLRTGRLTLRRGGGGMLPSPLLPLRW